MPPSSSSSSAAAATPTPAFPPAPLGLGSPLLLPCGRSLPNRLVKAPMTECLSNPASNLPNILHERLYERWSHGGAGVLITGNVQVDRRFMESPANVALEQQDEAPERLEHFQRFARAIKSGGSLAIMQLSHAGRQCPYSVNSHTLAPSSIPLRLPGVPLMLSPVATPREMTLAEIREVKERFVTATRLACKAGFDGVQLHSAHGYLLSSFLSPRFNKRVDDYGGSLTNRMRLLVELVTATRQVLGPDRILSVKLNSADFQRGGFTEDESLEVLKVLHSMKAVDFVEISGGTYENSVMMKDRQAFDRDYKRDVQAARGEQQQQQKKKREEQEENEKEQIDKKPLSSTHLREAYFLDFAHRVRTALPDLLLMLSGGWRSGVAMSLAIRDGSVDLIGLARPLCVNPSFPLQLLTSPQLQPEQVEMAREDAVTLPSYSLALNTPFASLNKTCEAALENFYHQFQMERMAKGLEPDVQAGLSTSSTLYFLTVRFMRNYVYEPRRKPKKAAMIASVLLGGTALVVACAAMRMQPTELAKWMGEGMGQQLSQLQAHFPSFGLLSSATSSTPAPAAPKRTAIWL